MEHESNTDPEFDAIRHSQSEFELEKFDKRDRHILTTSSILSQQCILLRSRVSSLQKENASLKRRLEPLEAIHQKLTSIYAMLAMLGAGLVSVLAAVKLLRDFLGK